MREAKAVSLLARRCGSSRPATLSPMALGWMLTSLRLRISEKTLSICSMMSACSVMIFLFNLQDGAHHARELRRKREYLIKQIIRRHRNDFSKVDILKIIHGIAQRAPKVDSALVNFLHGLGRHRCGLRGRVMPLDDAARAQRFVGVRNRGFECFLWNIRKLLPL